MSTSLLATKLYVPSPRPNVVSRPRLLERLNQGLGRKLTLVSAPAGFGKTTLLAEWVDACRLPVAWLSLDEGDSDPSRFLSYLVGTLQTVAPHIGEGVLDSLRSPQPPPAESILTALLNQIATGPDPPAAGSGDGFVLVLDDYHLVDAPPVDEALGFLLQHLPPQMRLVIATREDPQLPLPRLRARGQLTELRAADLRFTASEAAEFLNEMMGLDLGAQDVTALETRTEGWIAGLQLAALSMQGQKDVSAFIESFTGNHHFVLDYLLEEVLQQQPENVQTFLLRTSILDRLCAPLCAAVLGEPAVTMQETLQHMERANLFIVPLDNERRWYRYHHLFADLLRQRLQQQASSAGDEAPGIADLHGRASRWYEANGQALEAFYHAVAADDVQRAAHLVEGNGMPLQFRGAVAPVLNWLSSLPGPVLDERPSLWVMYASALSMTGQTTGVEEKLQAAESALQGAPEDDRTRNLIGHIAAIRALLAAIQYDVETVIAQSHRALAHLHADNLSVRTATVWKLGFAHQLQGDRAAAINAYKEAIATSEASGNTIINLSATIGLAQVQQTENQLHLAAENYRRAMQLAGDPPQPLVCEAHRGLAWLCYEWNDLEAAEQHGEQATRLAQQLETSDRSVASELFLVRLKLAQGDVAGAAARLSNVEQAVRGHNFTERAPEVTAMQVLLLLHQANVTAAAELAQAHDLPLSQARVYLAQGDPAAALGALEPMRRRAQAKGWPDERLRVMVLQALATYAQDDGESAVQLLGEALALAQPGGLIRTFVDEGPPMAQLLSAAADLAQPWAGVMPDYARELLAAFEAEEPPATHPLVEPLSPRELEVLQLVAQGLSNREIGERLFITLNTVKGHNRRIYRKLQVQRRTEAVARARELDLL